MTAPMPAKTGDVVHLFNSLLSAAWYGAVCDEDTPQMRSATLEAVQGDAVLTTPVLVGRHVLDDGQWGPSQISLKLPHQHPEFHRYAPPNSASSPTQSPHNPSPGFLAPPDDESKVFEAIVQRTSLGLSR